MKRIATLFVLALGIAALPIAAQERLAPSVTGETGLFSTLSAKTLPQGDWSFGLYYNNWDRIAAPLILQPLGTEPMDYDFNRLSASVGYGLTDRWEASVLVPYDFYKSDGNNRAGVVNGTIFFDDFDPSGFADVRLGTKFRVAGEREADFGLALNAFVDLPTGDEEKGLGTGEASYGVGMAITAGVTSFDLAYRITGDANNYDNSDEILAGVGFDFPLSDHFHLIPEINATFYGSGDTDPEDMIDFTIGGRYFFAESGWAMAFGVRTELNNIGMWDNGYCPIGGLLGLTYAPFHAPPLPPSPPPPVIEPPPPPPTPTPAPEVAPPPKEPEVMKIEEVRFEPNSARLTNIAKAILDEVALRMKERPAAVAIVTGHADSREKNPDELSLRRANAVKDYLVGRHGIDASRITAESRGSSDPIGDNATEAGRVKNRRSVIKLVVK